ncbi:MAG TPA: hypothetical protein VMN03_17495, partial [Burkholderiales bacterium]|nr:hypothetical protein [Burkholderiales bacterium]
MSSSLRRLRVHWILVACVFAVAAGPAWATLDPMESFDLSVPVAPTPLRVEGSDRLVYELHMTSFARIPLTLMRVEVLDAGSGNVIAAFAGDALRQRLGRIPVQGADDEPMSFVTGGRGVVYFEIELDARVRP